MFEQMQSNCFIVVSVITNAKVYGLKSAINPLI